MPEKQFIELLKNEDVSGATNFICDHYREFSKEQLKQIIEELIYGAKEETLVLNIAGDELESDWYYYFG